jgi:hypothetical protein
MNNIHEQAGEVSVTPLTRVEVPDSIKVRIVKPTGHHYGPVGSVEVISRSVALELIEKGFAVQEN